MKSGSLIPQALFLRIALAILCFHVSTQILNCFVLVVWKMPLVTDRDCKAMNRLNAIPIKLPMAFFTKLEQEIFKLVWKHKIIVLNSQEPSGGGGGYTSSNVAAVLGPSLRWSEQFLWVTLSPYKVEYLPWIWATIASSNR